MFTFYHDPGHGWLEVSAADLRAVNLTPRSFSQYSYQKGVDLFYLEEDCDASIFWNAYEAKHGRAPEIKNREGMFIRGLAPIHQGD